MKPFNRMIAIGMALCLSACSLYSPTYFGAKHTPTSSVDIYYSTKNIDKPFEVIGHMNARTGFSESSQESTRRNVIEKAKEIGGDAVVFSEINRQVNENNTDNFTIKVEVLKYK
ncbi:MAG: hypothetical protein EOO07_03460 [Chitinophagaceae bacterium]|nr:MAG: hypothetical protein EOO07_03460 [Chitinophagaceae bacterium]